MAEAEKKKKEEEAEKVISQIGKQLASSKTCPNKSTLGKLLKQASSSFQELKNSESLKCSVKPISDSLIKHGLLDHKDRDIRILVGICLCEIIRVLAPNPDFSPAVFRDIFRFLLSIFEELDDIASPYFLRRAKLLETVAKLQFCLVMLDTGCEDLVLKMFKSFFSVAREDHPQSLINSMSSIITSILEDGPHPLESNPSHSLIDVILQNIIKERKCIGSASHQLAVTVMQNCGEKLERSLCHFLKSCILERDAIRSVIKESYHEIIIEIYRISPHLLLSVIPSLTHELMTDQVDVRIKAINLIRKLLSMHGHQFARDYPHVCCELLNRFSDKSAEVRLIALSCAKDMHTTNISVKESPKILSAIQGRLLDHDDKVRVEAVNVVCQLAMTNLNLFTGLIDEASKRLRDKKFLVRSKALQKLVELYQDYCTRCAEGITLLNEHMEEIPCKVLMLCYEKDCLEFRPQSMELVLADLFPASLSVEERTRHWIIIFSLFKLPHLKALKIILSQKRRLRDGLKDFLNLWNGMEDNGSEQAKKKLESLVMKMSSCFPDPAKAKDCFQKFKELKNNEIFIVLQQFLTNQTPLCTETMKDVCERELGGPKALSEFIHLVYKKCSFNVFSSEHVRYILDCLSTDETEKKHLKDCQVQLLLTIISAFPLLLRGSEQQFQHLLREREIRFNEQLLEMLAVEGSHISIKLSDVYFSLEEVCLEGTRAQSKLAVFAIAALAGTEQFFFPKLCKTLVDSLCNGQNAPTVLQSLGCLAQHSPPSFEDLEKVITNYIVEKIFRPNDALSSKDLENFNEDSNCCSSCKLKIFGLKALVRSYLPHKHARLTRPIGFLLDIIQQMLQKRGFPAGSIPCVHDEAFICVAAAKSVLRLSRKWDLHISPQIFRLTISVAKDPSPWVRRSFASKVHRLLNNHAMPSRYACAFSFVALDCIEDLRNDGLKYLEEFIREHGKRAQLHETTTIQESDNHPAYLVVFLIHVIAHDPNFPSPDCRDENIYAEFLSPLFITVEALVNGMLLGGNSSSKSNVSLYLRSIFNAIKKAGDAIDAQMTPKLHFLAAAGISILDSLNISTTPVPHSPGLVLLPSSLYTSCPEMIEVNAYPLIGCKADAIFTKKLVSRLKFEVSGIVQTCTKHGQQSNKTSVRPSSGRPLTSTSKSGDNNLLVNNVKERSVELQTGHREFFDPEGQGKPAKSLHESVLQKDKSSDEAKHEGDAHGKPTSSENEVTGSCSRGRDTVDKCDSSLVGPSDLLRDDNQVKCSTSNAIGTQIVKGSGETLVGKRIKLWSPIEKCYYAGVVDGFDSTKSTHQITYKSGESDILSLDSETWEIDMDELQAQYCGDANANSEAEPLESKQEKNLPKKRQNYIKKISQPVKRAKRNEEALGTSKSKGMDMNGNNATSMAFGFHALSSYDSFISIRFEDNGVASWDKGKVSKLPNQINRRLENDRNTPDKANKTKSVVEHTKTRATLRWRKRIGHLLHLIRWRRSANKGNGSSHVGKKLEGAKVQHGWIRILTKRRTKE
ncbi:ARM repeat superfamily protein [Striga hermonthica]|uniref:ARM repeat superfamily protein n=1 Tax=Striga hermonthica TaxID=68872 RepID=A0A9N7RFY6_STRHE|nr:ARM repeat superfamily protein [Striga hermonthica]